MHFIKNHWSKTSKFQLFWTNVISILTPGGRHGFHGFQVPRLMWYTLTWIGLVYPVEPIGWTGEGFGCITSVEEMVRCEGSRNFRFLMDELRWTSKSNTIGTKRCISLCFCFGAMWFCFSPTGMVECNSLWHGHFTTKLSTANLTPLICLSFWIATFLVTFQPKKHTPGRNFKATNPLAHGFRFGRPSKNHWMRTSWYWH